MKSSKPVILWVDDEIALLKPHILFLQQKGYEVLTATNGADALDIVRKQALSAVLLDEMMDGLDGLAVLERIKSLFPRLPVIMITKNEAETLMEDALGMKISDYLTKPINPNQVYFTLKKHLEGRDIVREATMQNYMNDFAWINEKIDADNKSLQHWAEIHDRLTRWEIDLANNEQLDLQNLLWEQRRSANREFEKLIIKHYAHWVRYGADLPLSPNLLDSFVFPSLRGGEKVLFMLIDCLRYDQWLMLEPLLDEYFNIKLDVHLSILPTATPYSRNAIFAGAYPDTIHQLHPELYEDRDSDESMNRFEEELLQRQMARANIPSAHGFKYQKIIDSRQGDALAARFNDFIGSQFLTIVVNFVDILAHRRSESEILQEILPNEASYRNIVRSWFSHSYLGAIFRKAAEAGYRVVVSSDHGSVKVYRGTQIKADRETSNSMRYKVGRNLKVNAKAAYYLKSPADFRLPDIGVFTNYIFARDDYFFLYPNNFRKYERQYNNTFQHGGISMEEMILPVATLIPK
jgi:DNA-binding response OmpR family regulator